MRGYQNGPKKTETVVNTETSKDEKQVREFLGMVQYYRDLWPNCSEILALLRELAKGGPAKNVPIE